MATPTLEFLAFDLGATSGRAGVGSWNGRRFSLRELHRFPNEMSELSGHKYWDLPRLFGEMKTALRKAAAAGLSPRGIGVDTWGVDYGYIGGGTSEATAELLGLPFAYRDERTARVIETVENKLPRLYHVTGTQKLVFNTIYQLAEDLESRPCLPQNARRLLLLPDLLNWLLTGTAVAEYTIASTTGLLDAASRTWSAEILSALGVAPHLLPEVVPPGTPQGKLREELARETGCGKWPVTAVAGHDTGAAVAAVPAAAKREDWAYLSSGTWSLLGVELSAPLTTEEARRAGFTNEGGVGDTIRFLKNIMGLWLLEECRRIWARQGTETEITALCAAAEKAPAFAALVDPAWPEFLAPADMPAALAEFCRKTGQKPPETPAAFARCIFESLALAYRRELETMEKLTGRRIAVLHVVGGGSRNVLLNRMTAAATGLVVLAGPDEATMLGNVAIQATAAGEFSSPAEARAAVRESVSPREFTAKRTTEWDTAYEHFLKLGTRL